MAKKVQALLLKPVKWLGNAWEIVPVAMQYLKNVLMPQKLAVKADETLINTISQKNAKKVATKKNEKETMSSLMEMIAEKWLTISMKATDADTLYGKVDNKTIAKEIHTAYDVSIAPKYITLPDVIKSIGEFSFSITYDKDTREIPLHITKGK